MTRTRIVWGCVAAGAMAFVTGFGGLAAHAVSCVSDGATRMCGPERGGDAPDIDGGGSQRLFEVDHAGPFGLPVRDGGTQAGAGQDWWNWNDSSGRHSWAGVSIEPRITEPVSGDEHRVISGVSVEQSRQSWNGDEYRQTRAAAGLYAYDAPGAPTASAFVEQDKSPYSCDTTLWANAHAGSSNPSLYMPGLGCLVEAPEIPILPAG